MTDKNGAPVIPGCWVQSKPVGQDNEETILVTGVTFTGQDVLVERKEPESPEVQTKMSNGFQGQGGSFGGGGASGSW